MKNSYLIESSMVALGGMVIPLAALQHADATNVYTAPPGQTSVISAEITSATSGVIINGGGTVVFTNTSNTYTNETVISGGSTLGIDEVSQLGHTGGITLGDTISSGALSFDEPGYQLSSDLAYTKGILINAGGGTIVTDPGTLVSSGTTSVTSKYIATMEGVISGVGQLTVTGGGTLDLTANNVWTGGTLVNDGSTLEIGHQSNLGAVTNVLTLDSGTLAFDLSRPFSNTINLASGGGTLNVQGHHDILSGVIEGTGGLSVQDSSVVTTTSSTNLTTGTLTLKNNETYTGGTVVGGGTLILDNASIQGDATVTSQFYSTEVFSGSGSTIGTSAVTSTTEGTLAGIGSVAGNVTVENGGSVTPGINGSGTLTVGSYNQTAGTNLNINVGSGGSSELVVQNNATLAGNLNLQYDGQAHAGTYQYLAAGSTTGAFDTTNDKLYSVGLKSDVEGDTITLTQNSALPTGDTPTLIVATTNAAVDEAQFATRMLFDRLQSSRTTALAQRDPVALSDYHQVRNLSPYGVWVQPFGGFGSSGGGDGASGYTTNRYGLAVGVDGVMAPGWVDGVAIEYTHQNLTQSSGGSATLSTPRLEAYTGFWRGPYAIDLTLGDGSANIKTSRSLSTSLSNVLNGATVSQSFNETATGTRAANELTAGLQASANYLYHYTWAISPSAGVKFARLSTTGLTEGGTDYFNYVVASQHINSVKPFVDVQASRRFYLDSGAALMPSARVGVETEVGDRNHAIEAQTFGDSYNWTVNGVQPAAVSMDIDLSLAYETSKAQSFSIKFMGTESSSQSDQTFLGQYALRF